MKLSSWTVLIKKANFNYSVFKISAYSKNKYNFKKFLDVHISKCMGNRLQVFSSLPQRVFLFCFVFRCKLQMQEMQCACF